MVIDVLEQILALAGVLVGLAQLFDDLLVAVDLVVESFVLLEAGGVVYVHFALVLQVRCFVVFVIVLALV